MIINRVLLNHCSVSILLPMTCVTGNLCPGGLFALCAALSHGGRVTSSKLI